MAVVLILTWPLFTPFVFSRMLALWSSFHCFHLFNLTFGSYSGFLKGRHNGSQKWALSFYIIDNVPAVYFAGYEHRVWHIPHVGSNSCSATLLSHWASYLTHSSFSLLKCQMSYGNTTTQGALLLGVLSNPPKPTQGTWHEWMLLVLCFINFLLSRPRLQSIEIKLAATSKCVGIQNIIGRLLRSKWEQG